LDKQHTKQKIADLSPEELLQEKKKTTSQCVNLECRKEQLQVLIEKLHNLSNDRNILISSLEGQNIITRYFSHFGIYNSSIGDQLKQAKQNKKEIEKEIEIAKKQIKVIDEILNRAE
jgi:hypothetical protein